MSKYLVMVERRDSSIVKGFRQKWEGHPTFTLSKLRGKRRYKEEL